MSHTITVGWAFHHAARSFETDTLEVTTDTLFGDLDHPSGCVCQSFYALLDGDPADLIPLSTVPPGPTSLWRVESLTRRLTGMVQPLSTAEVAERWRLTPGRVRQLCQSGRVVGARKIGGEWLIPRDATITPGKRGPKRVTT